jgi:hypothetical protein
MGRGVEIRKMPKVYICDTGLANLLAKLGIQDCKIISRSFTNLKNSVYGFML